MSLPDIRELVPHSGRMMLLERLLAVEPDGLTAEVVIRDDSMFVSATGVGAWVGIEYMAQAVAALAGFEARQRGEPVKLGFLLGTRRYTCNQPEFALGSSLRVKVKRELQGENGLASFACRIDGEGVEAEATLTVFQPDNAEEFLRGNEV